MSVSFTELGLTGIKGKFISIFCVIWMLTGDIKATSASDNLEKLICSIIKNVS